MRTMSRPARTLPLSLGFLALALTAGGCLDRGGLDPLPDAGGTNDAGSGPDSGASGGGSGTGTGGNGTGGAGAGPGSGGAASSGGAPGTGGAVGSGGRTMTGTGGAAATGGRGGAGGAAATGGAKATGGAGGTGGKAMCGALCDIYCPYGNVLDANGCPTCKCNPVPECPQVKCATDCPHGYAKDEKGCQTCTCNPDPKACTVAECGPQPPLEDLVCPAGTAAPSVPATGGNSIVAAYACARNASGQCVWQPAGCHTCPTVACNPCPSGYEIGADGCSSCVCRPTPTPACGSYNSAATCVANTACTWLQPGCTEPALAAAGCFAKTSLGCTTDASCGAGHQCLKRTVNPCATTGAGGVTCGACARLETICQ